MAYGIAKIQFFLEKLGLNPNTTITRDLERQKNGFDYGEKIEWRDGALELILLDVLPNLCGIIVDGLEELPAIEN